MTTHWISIRVVEFEAKAYMEILAAGFTLPDGFCYAYSVEVEL